MALGASHYLLGDKGGGKGRGSEGKNTCVVVYSAQNKYNHGHSNDCMLMSVSMLWVGWGQQM